MMFAPGQFVQFDYVDEKGRMTRNRQVWVKQYFTDGGGAILTWDGIRKGYRRFIVNRMKDAHQFWPGFLAQSEFWAGHNA